ncbi:MAG: flagellar motor switch protein FliN [bacterium]|nr:flagellar motor switch protein FliN [bacterium]
MSDQGQLINIFVENWTSVYNTILGRDVVITVDSVETKGKGEVTGIFGEYQSFVSMAYGDGASDMIIIGLKNKLVSIISNMMIGLDSFKDEITDDDKDAFVEAVNQMFSSCQVPLKETLDLDMRFKDISFVESGDASDMLMDDTLQQWDITMDLPGIAMEKFFLATPPGFGATAQEAPLTEDISFDTGMGATMGAPAGPPTGHADHTGPPIATGRTFSEAEGRNIELLLDVELPITVRIGNTEMKLIDIMRLGLGSIVELEKMVDDPVEILANNQLMAKGEVVVCDGNYAVKITEVESREDRIKSLA